MDLRSLRYFCEVAACRSFSRAADRLRRSQPALSRQVKELEVELGVRLFERAGRVVTLTSQGRDLLVRARALLGQADELTERARVLADGRTAILRVGAAASTIQRIMPRLLARYRKKWAHVESYLIEGGSQSLLPALENGEIDIAITRYATTDVLGACPLFPTHIIAVVGRRHRLAGRATADVSDLANERLLIAPPDTTSRSLFEQACLAERVRPRIVLESHELNSLVAMADGGQGVAIVPSTVDISNYAVNVMALVHDGKPLGSWTSIVRDLRRALPDYVQAFVAEALAGLGREYPGRELALPPLPAPLRNLAAARA